MEALVNEKEWEINELNTFVQYLNDLLNDNAETVNLCYAKSKRYTTLIEQCVYELLTFNVSVDHKLVK